MPVLLAAAFSGLLFGAGLLLSGMADPARVLAFLTLGPGWDPRLMGVMAAGLAVAVPGFAWLARRDKPLFAAQFSTSTYQGVDRRLLGGAALFGLGWGLAGYCPGPAVLSAGLLQTAALLFLPAMLLGAWLADRVLPPQ